MDMDWSIVFDGPDKRACNERALVLQSQNIPFRIVDDESGSLLLVPAMVAERAKFEIWQYEQENRPRRKLERRPLPPPQNGIPGVIAYVLVLCVGGWLAGEGAFSRDWLTSGRVDGVLLRQGEWWRAITALTLHSGLRHLLGNIAFGVFFGLVAGRLLGSGVTWLVVVIAAAAGNVLNTILLDSAHRSVGASTAVFATLGLVAGFVWRSKLMAQHRWAYRLGPIVGGLALLAYTGTGDQNTDIGAHLSGFACGFGSGIILTLFPQQFGARQVQLACGAAAALIVAFAWTAAL
jgi:membrane associated rhomboid family serine protease